MNKRDKGFRSGENSLMRDPAARSNIASFIVMDVMQAAAKSEAAGKSVIHMEVGQPATAAPKAAREAVQRALDTEALGYTLALGNERAARPYLPALQGLVRP